MKTENDAERVMMKYGGSVVLRGAILSDAETLFATECAIVMAGVGVVQSLEDLPADATAYQERLSERLDELAEAERGVLMVALRDAAVIGYLQIERLGPSLIRHVAELNIGIHPRHQNQGIGTALMRRGLARVAAFADPQIRRIQLGVQASNDRAKALYRAFGFVVDGRRHDFHALPSGTYDDDLLMALDLTEVYQPVLTR